MDTIRSEAETLQMEEGTGPLKRVDVWLMQSTIIERFEIIYIVMKRRVKVLAIN